MQTELCKNTIYYTKRALLMIVLAFHKVTRIRWQQVDLTCLNYTVRVNITTDGYHTTRMPHVNIVLKVEEERSKLLLTGRNPISVNTCNFWLQLMHYFITADFPQLFCSSCSLAMQIVSKRKFFIKRPVWQELYHKLSCILKIMHCLPSWS